MGRTERIRRSAHPASRIDHAVADNLTTDAAAVGGASELPGDHRRAMMAGRPRVKSASPLGRFGERRGPGISTIRTHS